MSDLVAALANPVTALAAVAVIALVAAVSRRRPALRPEPEAGWIAARLGLVARAQDPELLWWLKRAGLPGRPAALRYLGARILCPILALVAAGIWVALTGGLAAGMRLTAVAVVAAGVAGYVAPAIYVQNLILRRQEALRREWPDALDLLLLSVESGLSIDAALDEVARQQARRAPVMAQELRTTLTDLAYLPDRREALANLAKRTDVPSIGTVVTALVQAERYGTPIGATLRIVTRDSRAARLAEAERRAAALSPRLTIPMILFFLPVLFAVIFTPGIIRYMMEP